MAAQEGNTPGEGAASGAHGLSHFLHILGLSESEIGKIGGRLGEGGIYGAGIAGLVDTVSDFRAKASGLPPLPDSTGILSNNPFGLGFAGDVLPEPGSHSAQPGRGYTGDNTGDEPLPTPKVGGLPDNTSGIVLPSNMIPEHLQDQYITHTHTSTSSSSSSQPQEIPTTDRSFPDLSPTDIPTDPRYGNNPDNPFNHLIQPEPQQIPVTKYNFNTLLGPSHTGNNIQQPGPANLQHTNLTGSGLTPNERNIANSNNFSMQDLARGGSGFGAGGSGFTHEDY